NLRGGREDPAPPARAVTARRSAPSPRARRRARRQGRLRPPPPGWPAGWPRRRWRSPPRSAWPPGRPGESGRSWVRSSVDGVAPHDALAGGVRLDAQVRRLRPVAARADGVLERLAPAGGRIPYDFLTIPAGAAAAPLPRPGARLAHPQRVGHAGRGQ